MSSNWEASLANIISRTNANLTTMNSKYGADNPTTSSSSGAGPLTGRTPSRFKNPPRQFSRTPQGFADQNSAPAGGPRTNQAQQGYEDLEARIVQTVRTLISDKFVVVERQIDGLRQQLGSLSAEGSRVSGEVQGMDRSVKAQEALVESLRHDMNGRR